MADILCLGELLIDFCSMQVDATLAEAASFAKAPGGAPANVAVAAARLGCASGFIGAVGDDPFGQFLQGVLADEGVDTSHLVRLAGVRTPLAFAAVRSDGAGDFFFVHDQAGLVPLRSEHIDEASLAAAAALHYGSISRIMPEARAATDKARDIARRHGLLISYDPNYRPRLWPDVAGARQRILEGFAGCHVAKISDQEWPLLFGQADFAAGAGGLLEMGVELVIRSEGAAGASFATRTVQGHERAFTVRSVEFTGAGDAFVACTIVELLQARRGGLAIADLGEARLRAIIRRANAVGALTTTKPGAIPALPTKAEVEAFLMGR
jgi:fructokinase